ncbi:glyoxalase superfamily protein [Stackebrandtia nassauensis]|uniref:Bleomycin resistance protein n=1 Tax=Stackebrandtia nassauensis (strain DSM 44728 / CIP 108903 / NRRL B-16338 / NBRC 102104 / LLR-40K-21) TaxID=446470 RepID=D3PWS9_STANL|nr:glyoxalase superfamily protein [Stackebrandtia nassauensis]ADD43301.1 conserved hypothetical protein [Stackebrandtia nassauensis DSM 44728]
MTTTISDAKTAARVLRQCLADDGFELSHSRALEIVAQQLGFADWNTASASLTAAQTDSGSAVAVLRIHDTALARGFYLDYLGFTTEWEHRFEQGMPVYMRIRRGETVLDLSEHHGDGTPGSVVWVPIGDLRSFHAELSRRAHPNLRPGIERDAPGGPTMEIIDPFGNVLRFCQPSE